MIYSSRLIKHPRKTHTCATCREPIVGEAIRLFGCAEIGEMPYVLYSHTELECAGKEALRKLKTPVSAVATPSIL